MGAIRIKIQGIAEKISKLKKIEGRKFFTRWRFLKGDLWRF